MSSSDTSREERDEQFSNISHMLVTLEVSSPDKLSVLREEHPENI